MNRFIVSLLLCAIAVRQINGLLDLHAKEGRILVRYPHYCNGILQIKYNQLCHPQPEVFDQDFLDSKEANTFLFKQRIGKRSLIEECCFEGCTNEEIYEVC
ncbi:uncharacterized protein LOC110991242 [Acanthaster planci]|uniref:Uncharacterized protein LOC110991242 n=1 Tax=Acanthaster planci TaxID=133434 RepID=A0A8B8A836_ACAPL|nr:uncharacterized protein LOC110991242 [Acanthaster planci]